jgi:hypothetical protein
MFYVCIENNQVTAILNYEPSVPETVRTVTITNEEEKLIRDNTHFFDTETNAVIALPDSELSKKEQDLKNAQHREFLNSTDWIVMRHIRQKALGSPTTLSEQEYLDLEVQRQNAANSIIN